MPEFGFYDDNASRTYDNHFADNCFDTVIDMVVFPSSRMIGIWYLSPLKIFQWFTHIYPMDLINLEREICYFTSFYVKVIVILSVITTSICISHN